MGEGGFGARAGSEELIDRPAGRTINTGLILLGGVILLGAAGLAGASYLPGEPLAGSLLFIPLLVAAFLVASWAMIVLLQLSDPRTRRGGNFRLPSARKALGELPGRVKRTAAGLVLLGLANATALQWAIRIGQPHYDRGRAAYLVHRGSSEVVLSAATYHHSLVLQNRGGHPRPAPGQY
jgi:hypothetical protein